MELVGLKKAFYRGKHRNFGPSLTGHAWRVLKKMIIMQVIGKDAHICKGLSKLHQIAKNLPVNHQVMASVAKDKYDIF